MRTVDVDGVRVAYTLDGDGPPLVLLHGYVADGPTTWRPQVDALRDEFTVVVWDAPGAGASSDPPKGFGLDGYADCLAGFVAALGLGPPHVAGLSFGAVVALALQRRHPDLARTLVLVSGYAGWGGSLPAEERVRRLRQAHALAALSPQEFVDALLPTMFGAATPATVVEAFRTSMLAFHPDGFRAMAEAAAEDVRDVLPRIDVPTLVVHGEDDVRAPRAVADDLHASIAGSTLVVLAGVGHLCSIEAPEAFNDALRRFLRNPARRPSAGATRR